MTQVLHFPMTVIGRYQAHHGVVSLEPEPTPRTRTTSEIWADLYPLRMTGPEDEDRRRELIEELRTTGEAFYV